MVHTAVLGIDHRLTKFQPARFTRLCPGQRQAFLDHHRPAPQHDVHRQDQHVQ